MGKIMRKGVAFAGSSNSAENIKYDETKNVKEAIDEVNGLLNMHYNAETDMVQIYYNGAWVDWKSAGLQSFYAYKNGLDSVGLQSRRSGASASSDYCSFGDDSITLRDSSSVAVSVYFSIDITNYTKLKVKYKCTYDVGSGNITIGIKDTMSDSLSNGLVMTVHESPTLNNITEITCDISQYVGTKYIYVGAYRITAEIYEIILE